MFIYLQFRYADNLDIFLMVIGGIAAALHGASLPLMILIFGEMVDSFVMSGNSSQALQQLPLDKCPQMESFCAHVKLVTSTCTVILS